MLLIVTVFGALASASGAPNPTNVFEIDITPEEAQRYLNSPPFSEPQLSGRTAVLPLVRWNDPGFRSAEAGPTLGHYWKNGHEIENTADYVEEVYDASQFHGQDGLGAYSYGYRAPESSKVENRAQSGEVTGSYTYKDSNNQDIKVRYWADSEGFHQEDNLPKVVLEPVQESEDVRQARLAHEKAWQEAAAAAAQQPDPQGEYSAKYEEHSYTSGPQGGQAQHEYQSLASEQQSVVASAPKQAPREGKAYAAAQAYQSPQKYGQEGQAQNNFNQQTGYLAKQQGQYQNVGYQQQTSSHQYGHASGAGQHAQTSNEEPEPTGPPRGFFYSFDYPVSIIVPKNAGQAGPSHPGQPIDQDTVQVNARG